MTLEDELCVIFGALTGGESFTPDTDFFERGGDSILAAKLVVQLRKRYDADLTMAEIMGAPAPGTLAALIREMADMPEDAGAAPRPNGSTEGEVSIPQESRLDIWRRSPMPRILTRIQMLRGELDRKMLEQAVAGLVTRHDSLRSVFDIPVAGRPRIAVSADPGPADIRWYDLRALADDKARHRYAMSIVDSLAAVPFELTAPPFLRVVAIRFTDTDTLLALLVEHIAADGESVEVLLADLAALYSGEALPEPSWSYLDFAGWQRRRLTGGHRVSYWLSKLELFDGVPWAGWTPTPQPPTPVLLQHTVPGDLTCEVFAEGRRAGLSPYMVAVALFGLAVGRVSGNAKVPVVSPTGNRVPGAENLVGWFAHALAFDLPATGDVFAAARAEILAAADNGEYPHYLLPGFNGSAQRPRVGPNMFFSYRTPGRQVRWSGLEAQDADIPPTAVSFGGIAINVEYRHDAVAIDLVYGREAWHDDSPERLLSTYASLLTSSLASGAS